MGPAGLAPLFRSEMTDLLRQAGTTDLPVRERLVWFWANHFTVSERAGNRAMGLLGAYIQEAICPHVTGRFTDMVKAVMRHPAMIYYLDGQVSAGHDSPVGLRQQLGINENLARECLELHTLGADAGYTQQDVTAFASILTGRWVEWEGDAPGFVFRTDMHEPGAKTFMRRTYPEGLEGSEAALAWIADHPATRHHIATQLLRHFVADQPPPRCIAQLETVLNDTGGDLRQAMLTIFAMPEAAVPLTKFRAPAEYIVAVRRALDPPPQPAHDQPDDDEPGHALLGACDLLGQRFMSPLLPNGWPDTADAWASGQALLKRADWAMTQTVRPGAPTAEAVVSATLGEHCSAPTRAAVKACATAPEALAMVFASPEFMRR